MEDDTEEKLDDNEDDEKELDNSLAEVFLKFTRLF